MTVGEIMNMKHHKAAKQMSKPKQQYIRAKQIIFYCNDSLQ